MDSTFDMNFIVLVIVVVTVVLLILNHVTKPKTEKQPIDTKAQPVPTNKADGNVAAGKARAKYSQPNTQSNNDVVDVVAAAVIVDALLDDNEESESIKSNKYEEPQESSQEASFESNSDSKYESNDHFRAGNDSDSSSFGSGFGD